MMDKIRWNKLLGRLRVSADERTFRKLESAYSEKHRAYHSVRHINDCLAVFDVNRDLLENPDAVEIAIWFHDAIYRPFSGTNEEGSAAWAVEFLDGTGALDDIAAEVSRLIIATKHNVPIQSVDESILVDIDLSILGSEPMIYQRFEDDIRFEYKAVPGFIFGKKRAQLLQGFLSREYIYNGERFRELYEDRARINVAAAIETLLG